MSQYFTVNVGRTVLDDGVQHQECVVDRIGIVVKETLTKFLHRILGTVCA